MIYWYCISYMHIVRSSHFQSFSSFNGHGHGLFFSFGLFDRKVSPGEWSCWWSESLVQELGEFPGRKQILGSLYMDKKVTIINFHQLYTQKQKKLPKEMVTLVHYVF